MIKKCLAFIKPLVKAIKSLSVSAPTENKANVVVEDTNHISKIFYFFLLFFLINKVQSVTALMLVEYISDLMNNDLSKVEKLSIPSKIK